MLSVVIPVYNEEDNLRPLVDRLEAALNSLEPAEEYEVVLVDDGSRDRSLEIMKELARKKKFLRVVELIRNYGQHAAVFAGLEHARGDIVVTMDADLQNPPEEVPRLVQAMREGDWEVVGSVRQMRKDSVLRRLPSAAVNAMARRITGVHLTDWGCMLRAYRRSVVDAMIQSREHSTFIPALATIFAKRITEIPVAHAERAAGVSQYNFKKLLNLQFDLLTSFSDLPLKTLLYSGMALAAGGVAFGAFLAVLRLIFGAEWAAQGVFTLFAILFFFVGAQFFALGLIGEYVGRIYREVRHRPRYLVRKVHEEPK
ncbi:MAG TPA: glycosyltransferase [bacterium]|nr:glycosyltransferase [bacterium]